MAWPQASVKSSRDTLEGNGKPQRRMGHCLLKQPGPASPSSLEEGAAASLLLENQPPSVVESSELWLPVFLAVVQKASGRKNADIPRAENLLWDLSHLGSSSGSALTAFWICIKAIRSS